MISQMRVDWRSLFDVLRIEWRDRGANTSSGNINIPCPWCRNDPSYHLAVAEERAGYYCYREPNRHSGTDLRRLLVALRVPYAQTVTLLNRYNLDAGKPVAAERPSKSPPDLGKIRGAWDRFVSASRSGQAVTYLEARGFTNPQAIIEAQDLRVAIEGSWARRLLIPYMDAGQVLAWTGRTLDDRQPRYLTHDAATAAMVYVAARPDTSPAEVIIVEGPLDALKIAAAVDLRYYCVIALTGKNLPAAKLLRIAQLSKGCRAISVALDADVPVSSAYTLIADIAQACSGCYIERLRLPPQYKDPAELPLTEISPWLRKTLQKRS